jgi:hypothetical protein
MVGADASVGIAGASTLAGDGSIWPILLQKSHLAVPPILIGLLGRGSLYLPRIVGG